jgi:hypothetical protein
MNAKQAIAAWLEANNMTESDLNADYRGDTDEIFAMWNASNPAPVFVKDSHAYAVDAALYAIHREKAIYTIKGEHLILSQTDQRVYIEQAIQNRSEGQSMLAAAYAYTDHLLQNIEHETSPEKIIKNIGQDLYDRFYLGKTVIRPENPETKDRPVDVFED